MKSTKLAAVVITAACAAHAAHAAWTDITLNPWHAMASFAPGGTTPNDQATLVGTITSQEWDLEAVAINYSTSEVNIIGGYNFEGFGGPATAIFLSSSVITSVLGTPGNGYQTVANPGFSYAIRLGAGNTYDVYSLAGTSLVTALYESNRGLPTDFVTGSGETLVASGSYSLVHYLTAGAFTGVSGLNFTGEDRFALTLPIAALQGERYISYNEWCGNDSVIGDLQQVPEPSTYAAGITMAGSGLMIWVRSRKNAKAVAIA